MIRKNPMFLTKFAVSPDEFHAAQRLRYQIFVKELGGGGELVDHKNELECDEFDPFFDHLLLYDQAREVDPNDKLVGVYRILSSDKASELGRF